MDENDPYRIALNQIYQDCSINLKSFREMVRQQDKNIAKLREDIIETNIQLLELSQQIKNHERIISGLN